MLERAISPSAKFDGMRETYLGHDVVQVMFELVVSSADIAHTTCLVAWSTGSTEDLLVSA
jgi:hypothetical protein